MELISTILTAINIILVFVAIFIVFALLREAISKPSEIDKIDQEIADQRILDRATEYRHDFDH